MVTYDRDEPFHQFRCWIYERIDLFTIYLSRSISSQCGPNQTSHSYLPEEGADLHLILTENERIRKDNFYNFFVSLKLSFNSISR
jgi:hypothetical protein